MRRTLASSRGESFGRIPYLAMSAASCSWSTCRAGGLAAAIFYSGTLLHHKTATGELLRRIYRRIHAEYCTSAIPRAFTCLGRNCSRENSAQHRSQTSPAGHTEYAVHSH